MDVTDVSSTKRLRPRRRGDSPQRYLPRGEYTGHVIHPRVDSRLDEAVIRDKQKRKATSQEVHQLLCNRRVPRARHYILSPAS
jgi:hypothetical protein